MSGSCCGQDVAFDGVSRAYKRVLLVVIAINASMFLFEGAAGFIADSQALKADALDFLADSVTYAISLAVIGAPLLVRARVALLKGLSLAVMGLWVLISTGMAVWDDGVPLAPVMGGVGFLALLANLASVALLMRYREGDSNVRSVWLCSRNDAIGNIAVVITASGVWAWQSAWPDLVVAAGMALLFFSSAVQIVRQALAEQASLQAVESFADHTQAQIR